MHLTGLIIRWALLQKSFANRIHMANLQV